MKKTLLDRVRNGEFEVKTPYPMKPIKPKSLEKPMKLEEIFSISEEQMQTYKNDKAQYEAEVMNYEKKIKEYKDESSDLEQEFSMTMFLEHGVENEDINQIVYGQAYEEAHSGGREEVLLKFISLMEMTKKVVEAMEPQQDMKI